MCFLGVMLGPYMKSRGTRGTKISANADLITVDTYHDMYNKGKQFENQFFIYGPKCILFFILGPILLSSYPLTHIYVHVK